MHIYILLNLWPHLAMIRNNYITPWIFLIHFPSGTGKLHLYFNMWFSFWVCRVDLKLMKLNTLCKILKFSLHFYTRHIQVLSIISLITLIYSGSQRDVFSLFIFSYIRYIRYLSPPTHIVWKCWERSKSGIFENSKFQAFPINTVIFSCLGRWLRLLLQVLQWNKQ